MNYYPKNSKNKNCTEEEQRKSAAILKMAGIEPGVNLYSVEQLSLVWKIVTWRTENVMFEDKKTEARSKIEFNRVLLQSQGFPVYKAIEMWLNKLYILGVESGKII